MRIRTDFESHSMRAASLLLALFCVFSIGCFPSSKRPSGQAVSGKVTLDGTPMTDVLLVFTPVEVGAVGATALVQNGEFSCPKESGPSAGKMKVSFTPIQPDLEDYEAIRGRGDDPFSQVELPPRLLKPGTLEVEVYEEQRNEIVLDLTWN